MVTLSLVGCEYPMQHCPLAISSMAGSLAKVAGFAAVVVFEAMVVVVDVWFAAMVVVVVDVISEATVSVDVVNVLFG